ncbi:dephospho-CoA kinase [Arcticibacter pallidicorallinus]|uniref:Dephospho-CoA kinase n=1 Tax=Arcticibacter pallidicorallinus TaxID=1259464 RepID=A0A2T0UC97_9SPHI|nr:dephospho-CoA kinase [Arcticibacter pallidicorallinus]PRY55437.1 dephospho-CoA kinase [Arcticibacter pallidicorallinus]
MLKIGITGGIGSGKTTVCRIFELLGVAVYYADVRAKMLMQTDLELIEGIKMAFGKEAYNGLVLNRAFLGAIVFNNAERLQQLNGLVHPAVFRDFDTWSLKQKGLYVLKEAAILFESGSSKDCAYTILVKSPVDLRTSRVMLRDGISKADVIKRMDKQMSDEEKDKLASFVILNDEVQLVIPQVLALHNQITDLALINNDHR